jgi:hypothetical protein
MIDIVVFRRFPDGDVIALLPYLPAECLTAWPCQSYMHIGQHGAADPGIVHNTKRARPREYASLKAELERIGYRLAVRRRFPSDAYDRRKKALAAIFPSPWETE